MKNIIIDGGNLLHRTYHAAKAKDYVGAQNKNMSHVVLFLNQLKVLQSRFLADRLFLAWDIRDHKFKNFRQEAVEYKGSRDREETKRIHQFDDLLWKMTTCLGVQNIKANKLEGDDIIYFLVKKYSDDENIVVSNDGDFYQLFNIFQNIKIYNPQKNVVINENNAIEYNGGVTNDRFVFYKAVMGDNSDNIKGLFRYGPVKSKKFVENFKENFDNLSEEEQKTIKLNIKLMDLRFGLKTYRDEEEFYENQISDITTNIDKFFKYVSKLEITEYLGYSVDWYDHFSKDMNNNSMDFEKLMEIINN